MKQRIKWDKLHFKTTNIFGFQFAVLKECNTFDSNSLSFIPSCSLQPTNNCFCQTESGINLQTILHLSMNYWFPSWHSDVVTTLLLTLSRCGTVENELYRRQFPTLWQRRSPTLSRGCYNVATTLSIGLLGHFTTDYSDFFSFIETWKLQKC